MSKTPVVLTIAGSDSGGGAGIQADLKTFAALQTHGVSVITCLTAQNPRGVTGVEPCSAAMLRGQLEAVAAFRPGAAKTGMLYSAGIIREVAAFLRGSRGIQIVVDPVMLATSGARLIEEEAVEALTKELLPLATLVTPNAAEAETLTGLKLVEPESLREAARAIYGKFGCAALVKGGHLNTGRLAIDVFYDGDSELLLEAPRKRGVATHGTGCACSAAIAAFLARGATLVQAVSEAKEFITGAIHGSLRAGPFTVLNPFYPR